MDKTEFTFTIKRIKNAWLIKNPGLDDAYFTTAKGLAEFIRKEIDPTPTKTRAKRTTLKEMVAESNVTN